MILDNRRIPISEVPEDVGISFGSCQAIFMDVLNMKLAAAKNISKQSRIGDESWVYGYDNETKAQSSQWMRPEELGSKKQRQVRSNVKVLLTVLRLQWRAAL